MPVKKDTTAILTRLRELMITEEAVKGPLLTGYLIPSSDAHYSEYLSACDERRAFISGFHGSIGDALVTANEALMWTNGRYHSQASEQMDENWTLMKFGLPETPTLSGWINRELPQGSIIGVDPRVFTNDAWAKLTKDLNSHGNKLVPVEKNLVDLIWEDRPPPPCNPVTELSLKFAGKSTEDKLIDIRQELANKQADYLLITALDEIAWLLNWRGSDIPYKSVFFAYCIISQETLEIFIDSKKVPIEMLDSLSKNDENVRIHQYCHAKSRLEELVSDNPEAKIWLSKYASYYLTSTLPETRCILKLTPIAFMKAMKNEAEALGMKACHVRDGVAVCQFFGWLEKAIQSGEHVTEADACNKLEEFRKKRFHYLGPSFPMIIGSGQNAAKIYHHNADNAPKFRTLSTNDVFMVDSGGQYLDGTTDVARTIHFGNPTRSQKECFTAILKGQIQQANSMFPKRLSGNNLDKFQRKVEVWERGLDYLNVTGHRGASFLEVQAQPSEVATYVDADDIGLQENMFMSTDPVCYGQDEHGIRLEDIIQVVKADARYNFGKRTSLTFEDVTMVPFQQKMIDSKILSPIEMLYLTAYNDKCRNKVGDYMIQSGISFTDPGYLWLMKETEPIKGTPSLQ